MQNNVDWDTYLLSLSANTRQKIRRLLRQVDAEREYREKIDGHIETMASKARGAGLDYFFMNTSRPPLPKSLLVKMIATVLALASSLR